MRLISEFNFTVKDIGAQKSKATGLRWRLVMEHGGKHVFLTMYSALFLQWGMLPNKVACASVLSHFSRVWRFATPWAVACQAPLSMWILQARILEWAAISSSRRSSDPGIKPTSLASPVLAGDSLPLSHLGNSQYVNTHTYKIWITVLYTWNYHNVVNELYFNSKREMY